LRTAYLAGFHAAQALIFETHGRTFKTHSGARGEFARLVKEDARVDHELRSFLGYSYQLKEIAECITSIIASNSPTPRAPPARP
jgi:uncharacterized protein (UPF0332 family)